MKRRIRAEFAALPLFLALVGAGGSPPVHAQSVAPPAVAAVPTKADPAAYDLLKTAHDRRSNLPKDFGGFTADVTLNDNGVETMGSVTYTTGKGLEMQFANRTDNDAQKWLQSALLSAVAHRMAGDFSKGDGSHPLTFTPDDHSPLGRQISLNDNMKSFYRVRDHQIMEVTRTMGNSRFTITMLENITVDDNQYLPKHFVVTYFNATTGAIEHAEYFTDTHTRIGGAWMPTARRVVTAANGAFTTRSYELKNLRLLPALPTTQANR